MATMESGSVVGLFLVLSNRRKNEKMREQGGTGGGGGRGGVVRGRGGGGGRGVVRGMGGGGGRGRGGGGGGGQHLNADALRRMEAEELTKMHGGMNTSVSVPSITLGM